MAIKSGYTAEDLAKMGPDYITKKRLLAEALMRDTTKQRKIEHPFQGLAQLAETYFAAKDLGDLDTALKTGQTSGDSAFKSYLGGFSNGSPARSSSSAQIPMSEAAGEVAATSPTTGDTFSPFMGTIKAGGVQNPYALAAIAATGRAESGWSAKNANRTWSDPSESGQPGTAGGIMSWRGPRYQALAATGDLSPQGQAKFFLNEDPSLIQKLNGAKSVEEAQQLMNNAWAFAGYDRPGGESARRLGYAKGYLPTFQGNAEVASLDPSSGMPAPSSRRAGGYVDPMVSAPNSQREQLAQAVMSNDGAQPSTPPHLRTANQLGSVLLAQSGPSLQSSADILSNPWVSEDRKKLALTLLGQQNERQNLIMQQELKQQDPAYRLGLEKSQLELDALRNPRMSPADQARIDLDRQKFDFERNKPRDPLKMGQGETLVSPEGQVLYAGQPKPETTDDIREYNFAVNQGYTGSFSDFQQQMKKAGATSITVGGGDNKQVFDAVADSAATARSAVTGLNALREARNAVDGGIISGAGADARLGLQRVGALLGVANPQTIENTETFRSAIAPQVAAMMKATVGSTQISNADREFAEKAAGGSIGLNEGTIRRLLDIMERAGTAAVTGHRDRLNKVYPEGHGFDRERALFDVGIPDLGAGAKPFPRNSRKGRRSQRSCPRRHRDFSRPEDWIRCAAICGK
ncbi:hypothetical protein [Agrobacterium sp. ST15.13.015]|uniref:hypothetical protein n=1 Tax=Agrobacterium sp. ST15.13.015 TaxID=3017319 RepID=UPI0022BEE8FB|nr:hypothetical protein [Agrobacterium sp. ST15.13.015]MCZ7498861.1 hypothetical protein [Rhizobium rhizogenes]